MTEQRNEASTQRANLLAAVERIRDTLQAQAAIDEERGFLSQASMDALTNAGIFAMKLPRVLGGEEADPITQIDVIDALSASNPAAGWCAMIGATGLAMPGAFLPDEAVKQVFSGPQLPHGAVVAVPAGKAIAEPGGFRLTGHWRFGSGVRYAEWISAGGWISPQGDEAPIRAMFVFPAAQAAIHDNWHVVGLQGTGSCDFSVQDLFVPEEFTWHLTDAEPRRGGPLYRLGIPGIVANEYVGFALGVARCALGELMQVAGATKRGVSPAAASLANRAVVQAAIGESDIKLRAARALAVELNAQAFAVVCAGNRPSPELQSELRSIAAYCTEVATEVVTRAFRLVGGSAIYQGSVLQRCLRDINVASQHFVVSAATYENLGQFKLGLGGADPMR